MRTSDASAPRLPTGLRGWAAVSGAQLDHDRPTRQTAWHVEPPADAVKDVVFVVCDEDFVRFVVEDVTHRRMASAAVLLVEKVVNPSMAGSGELEALSWQVREANVS